MIQGQERFESPPAVIAFRFVDRTAFGTSRQGFQSLEMFQFTPAVAAGKQ